MASSSPILWPSASTTFWPRQSRIFSASNMPLLLSNSATLPYAYGVTRIHTADPLPSRCWARPEDLSVFAELVVSALVEGPERRLTVLVARWPPLGEHPNEPCPDPGPHD